MFQVGHIVQALGDRAADFVVADVEVREVSKRPQIIDQGASQIRLLPLDFLDLRVVVARDTDPRAFRGIPRDIELWYRHHGCICNDAFRVKAKVHCNKAVPLAYLKFLSECILLHILVVVEHPEQCLTLWG